MTRTTSVARATAEQLTWEREIERLDREADDFFSFIADVSGANNGERHPLQVMYGVGGEKELLGRPLAPAGWVWHSQWWSEETLAKG
jgi:hypothetical protein